jgi:hypothetical protein
MHIVCEGLEIEFYDPNFYFQLQYLRIQYVAYARCIHLGFGI